MDLTYCNWKLGVEVFQGREFHEHYIFGYTCNISHGTVISPLQSQCIWFIFLYRPISIYLRCIVSKAGQSKMRPRPFSEPLSEAPLTGSLGLLLKSCCIRKHLSELFSKMKQEHRPIVLEI